MDSRERVLAACAFRPPDRIPRIENFWDFPDDWRQALGNSDALTDISIRCPVEAAFPSRARRLEQHGDWITEVDTWGRTIRRRADAYFVETLSVAMPEGTDPDRVIFDPPTLDSRFQAAASDPASKGIDIARDADAGAGTRHCVFGKTGGPYLRTTFLRGETQFLMDIAGDPPLAKALADKVGDHLTAVGVEEIRRWNLQETGIWIYDDMAYNDGPMFSPKQFEEIFLPAYRRMINAYKHAGAKYVFLHSDGDVNVLLDMLVDAGIDGLNPIEKRAHMNMTALRERYPRLVLTGGMCNTDTLPHGPRERIEAEAAEIIDLGRDGGVAIGTHSISPKTIALENYLAYHEMCRTHGQFR